MSCAKNFFNITAAQAFTNATTGLPTRSNDGVPANYVMVVHSITAYIHCAAVDSDYILTLSDQTSAIDWIKAGKSFLAQDHDTIHLEFAGGLPLWPPQIHSTNSNRVLYSGTNATTDMFFNGDSAPQDGLITIAYEWVPPASLRT